MYLCSTLRLAWGGKFCCCQILIDDLQLCLANRNTFFSVCNDRSSAPEADQSRDDPQKLMLLTFSLLFSRWLKHVFVTGAAVQMAGWFFLWLLGFRSFRFSHSLTCWNQGREWVARRQSMGAFFLAISLFHYCFLLHGGSLFCFTSVLLMPGRSMIFSVSAPWSITLSDISFLSPDCKFWPQNSAQVDTSTYLFTRLKVMWSLG